MKLLNCIISSATIVLIGTSAHAKGFDLLHIDSLELTPVVSVKETTPEQLNSDSFYQFKLRPTEFVKPISNIEVLNVESDSNKKRQVDYRVTAGTTYYRVHSRKSELKVYCTQEFNALSRHKKKDKPLNARTCLVDTDKDGKFDKVYLSSAGLSKLSINSIATALITFGTKIEPVTYSATQPDPSIILTAVIGYLPDLNQFKLFSKKKISPSEMKFDRSKSALYFTSDDPNFFKPFVVKGSIYRLKKITSDPKAINFKTLDAEMVRDKNGNLMFNVNAGPKIGEKFFIEMAIF